MMMGLATLTRDGAAAVLFYLVVYLFMNLGAFAIVAFLRNLTGSEDLKDFRGLVNRAPVLVIALAVCLLSLLGMPPLAGFAAKFQIFRELYNAANMYTSHNLPGLGSVMIALLVIGGLNSVLSLVYYIKVLKVMIVDKPLEEVEGREPARLPVSQAAKVYAGLVSVVLVVLGILWNPLSESSYHGVNQFQNVPAQAVAVAQEKAR
jgi:NADH-quinone oxidoreductase subunit N